MNGFVKTFFTTLLAVVVGGMILSMLSILALVSFSAAFGTRPFNVVEAKTVLKIDFAQTISDNPSAGPVSAFDIYNLNVQQGLALYDVLTAIEKAASDDNIEGIYLNPSMYASVGMASMDEIRTTIEEFKESGKFVISYADSYSQGMYYLCSVADMLYVNPEGSLDWRGLASNVMFYKGMFDKLGLDVEVMRHGDFKAAVEPFISDRMSPENREQITEVLNTIWGKILEDVSVNISVDSASLQKYADELSVVTARNAVDCGMASGTLYASDIAPMLAGLAGYEEDDMNYISLSDYIHSVPAKRTGGKISANKVEIVYAEGQIIDGDRPVRGYIVGNALRRQMQSLADDDDVKAVVLRINSPGGSALASEVIWREVERLREKKPVIVSMGNVAASGGYYIAAPADAILASPATQTGSIGVFGLMLNGNEVFRDKLGLTFDVVKTGRSADVDANLFGLGVRSLTDLERERFMESIESIYTTFVGHVADGRNMTYDEVDAIAGGRVWSGVSALDRGLIDGFGGLRDAINLAADRAGLGEDFTVTTSGGPHDKFTIIMELLSMRIRGRAVLQDDFQKVYAEYRRIMDILSTRGVQAVMPYSLDIR